MKILPAIALIFAALVLASSAHAQRVFDNFDRSQSVSVIRPPAPKVEPMKKGKRGKNATQNSLVQKTVLTANVTDGLATREGQPIYPASYSKLSMGSNTMLKGFYDGKSAARFTDRRIKPALRHRSAADLFADASGIDVQDHRPIPERRERLDAADARNSTPVRSDEDLRSAAKH
jgi:hypothetical protein